MPTVPPKRGNTACRQNRHYCPLPSKSPQEHWYFTGDSESLSVSHVLLFKPVRFDYQSSGSIPGACSRLTSAMVYQFKNPEVLRLYRESLPSKWTIDTCVTTTILPMRPNTQRGGGVARLSADHLVTKLEVRWANEAALDSPATYASSSRS